MRIRVLLLLLLFCSIDVNANPLFYKVVRYVDYFDVTQEYLWYDSNNNLTNREYQGVVYDSKGKQIGTYTTDSKELFQDRFYYNNAGKYLGSSRFLYFNSSLVAKLMYSNSSKKKVGTFSYKWSLGNVVDFFLDGSQLRLTLE